MNNDVDLARETGEWLQEGARPLPSRVRDGAMSAVSRTRQLSPAHPRWIVRLARAVVLGAAAAAVVMVVAYGPFVVDGIRGLLLPRGSTPVGASASSGTAGKIAFLSDRDGDTEIYVMNADGSGQTNVSHGSGDFNGPGAWSPDGSRFAFTSDRDGKVEVYVVKADGSGLTNVSNDPCGAGVVAWSRDGSRIAFSSGPVSFKGKTPPAAPGCVSTIYVVNADGSGRTNLTNGPGDSEFGGWSPDSSRFAFTSDRDGNTEIYVVNADGSGLTNLSNDPGFNNFSGWSPDSSRVRFISECKVVDGKLDLNEVNADGSGLTYLGLPPYDPIGFFVGCAPTYDGPIAPEVLPGLSVGSGAYAPDGTRDALAVGAGDGNGEEIYVINADRSGLTRLTYNHVDDSNIVWSPDSSRIAWHRVRDGNTEIWVVNPDGSGLTRLSSGPEGDALRDGGWSPDSSRIAFVSNRDGNGEIYLVNADGSGLTNLTNNPAQDYGPVWSPAR